MYKTEQDLERVIALGKPLSVIENFASDYLQGVEHENWTEAKRTEHESLFPVKIDGDPVYDTDGTTVLYHEQIDNPDFVSFDAWMDEKVEVQVGTRDVLDVDGVTVIGTEPIMELQPVRPYVEVPVDVAGWKASSPLFRTYLKEERSKAVAAITVTDSQNRVFDGDEISQGRIARAILGLPDDVMTINWVLSDNTVVNITRVELLEVLQLAGAAQSSIWVL